MIDKAELRRRIEKALCDWIGVYYSDQHSNLPRWAQDLRDDIVEELTK